MKSGALVLIALLSLTLPAPARSGVGPDYCRDCVLGLFDQPQMLTNFGDITPGVPKDLYLGIRLTPAVQGLVVIEFSVAGVRLAEDGILIVTVEGVTNPLPNILLGTVPAPADTSASSNQVGGMAVAWPSCIVGSQALLRIQILTFAPIPNGKRLLVMHRFPPTNPNFGLAHPAIALCDAPIYTPLLVRGGDYILNPVIQVEGKTWSGVKDLYRDATR
jgi:hypothetical protein